MARILVIDDDEVVRSTIRKMLQMAGYEIEEAFDGEEGVKLYNQDPTDVVITDIMMPEKSGFETIQEIRSNFPDAKIIAITGGGLHLLPVAHDLGALRIFEKPFHIKELLETVKELLEEQ